MLLGVSGVSVFLPARQWMFFSLDACVGGVLLLRVRGRRPPPTEPPCSFHRAFSPEQLTAEQQIQLRDPKLHDPVEAFSSGF